MLNLGLENGSSPLNQVVNDRILNAKPLGPETVFLLQLVSQGLLLQALQGTHLTLDRQDEIWTNPDPRPLPDDNWQTHSSFYGFVIDTATPEILDANLGKTAIKQVKRVLQPDGQCIVVAPADQKHKESNKQVLDLYTKEGFDIQTDEQIRAGDYIVTILKKRPQKAEVTA